MEEPLILFKERKGVPEIFQRNWNTTWGLTAEWQLGKEPGKSVPAERLPFGGTGEQGGAQAVELEVGRQSWGGSSEVKGIGSLGKQRQHCPEGRGSQPKLLRSFCFRCNMENEWRESVQLKLSRLVRGKLQQSRQEMMATYTRREAGRRWISVGCIQRIRS